MRDYMKTIPPYLKDFQPNFDFSHVSEERKAKIKEIAQIEKEYRFVHLTMNDFIRYQKDGIRKIYETPYFKNRKVLADLVLAYALEKDESYIHPIIDGIDYILSEGSWVIPPHNYYYVRDSHVLPLWDGKRLLLALFSLETGALLSMVYFFMKERLDNVTPLIMSNVYEAIKTRILQPYLQDHFWWMGNGDEPMNN